MIVAQTDRLYLREMTPDDAEQAYLLNLDPEVIRYTGDVAFASVEEARNFLMNYESFKKYGFGRWAVIDKQSHEFLGWCGLKYSPEINEYDIGFRFFKKHWGKGYATESAMACLDLGFNRFNMPSIVGRAAKENHASINVLKKLGLTYLKDDMCHHDDAVIYIIHKK
ncbi:MAG: GCN5-related N-acetyltransferase [Bacteroidetes bacterium]|jgi:RimJ/RimL family protein N-acetyltransferase|nr:GCN5-related N-acetyltransferase [Bacteroidota bacterium]